MVSLCCMVLVRSTIYSSIENSHEASKFLTLPGNLAWAGVLLLSGKREF